MICQHINPAVVSALRDIVVSADTARLQDTCRAEALAALGRVMPHFTMKRGGGIAVAALALAAAEQARTTGLPGKDGFLAICELAFDEVVKGAG
jgi:hypothetical protein